MGMGARASARLSAFCPGAPTEALEDAPAELLDPPAAHSPISAKGATAKASVNPMTIADLCTIELSAMRAKSMSRKGQPRLRRASRDWGIACLVRMLLRIYFLITSH